MFLHRCFSKTSLTLTLLQFSKHSFIGLSADFSWLNLRILETVLRSLQTQFKTYFTLILAEKYEEHEGKLSPRYFQSKCYAPDVTAEQYWLIASICW